MGRARNRPALVAHGGAGSAGPGAERAERRRAMMAAMRLGAGILRANGSALEAVVATVAALEDHPLFNAGYGSLLNSQGNVEMDASVMFAEPVADPAALRPASRGKRSGHTDHSNGSDYSCLSRRGCRGQPRAKPNRARARRDGTFAAHPDGGRRRGKLRTQGRHPARAARGNGYRARTRTMARAKAAERDARGRARRARGDGTRHGRRGRRR